MLGAVTFMPMRYMITLGAMISLVVISKVIMLGYKRTEEPLAGWRC